LGVYFVPNAGRQPPKDLLRLEFGRLFPAEKGVYGKNDAHIGRKRDVFPRMRVGDPLDRVLRAVGGSPSCGIYPFCGGYLRVLPGRVVPL
jgi:hypothetical protein